MQAAAESHNQIPVQRHDEIQQVRRPKNRIFHKPIVVGTHAVYLGRRSRESETHKWCCYIRGPRTEHGYEDISSYIESIEFTLDESFTPHILNIPKAPFEIQNTGWGQFQIGIKIYFKDPACKPVELGKELVLYDGDLPPSPKRPVIREDYNELVFVEPTDSMRSLLFPQQPSLTQVVHQAHEESKAAQEDSVMKDESEAANDSAQKKESSIKQASFDVKAIEQDQLEKFYQDKQFENKEKHDLDLLQTAVSFIKEQVKLKREKLADIDRQMKEERLQVKQTKDELINRM